VACENFDVPQQWVGSSLGICVNVKDFDNLEKIHENDLVEVNIFDWGRSELDLKEDFDKLPSIEKQQRIVYWDKYLNSILRILLEC